MHFNWTVSRFFTIDNVIQTHQHTQTLLLNDFWWMNVSVLFLVASSSTMVYVTADMPIMWPSYRPKRTKRRDLWCAIDTGSLYRHVLQPQLLAGFWWDLLEDQRSWLCYHMILWVDNAHQEKIGQNGHRWCVDGMTGLFGHLWCHKACNDCPPIRWPWADR